MNETELREAVTLASLVFVLFSLAMFWKLYLFKPPKRTQEEDVLQIHSHKLSNESAKLQVTIRRAKWRTDVLKELVTDMQHRNGHG